jgi:4-hydroxy-2-oxoheptanedioate aldolase
MRVNNLKAKLAAGETVVGTMAYIPSPKLVEILGWVGFDFVMIDMEHGPIDMVVAEDMIRAAEVSNTTPMLRVTRNSPELFLRAFDSGAQGVHVPDVSSAADAKLAAQSSKYAPLGRRGLGGVRAARHALDVPLSEYAPRANEQTMVVVHIESKQAVDNLDEMLAVDGIDVYFIGPEDLSNTMGIPGQSKDPRVVKLIEDSIRKIVAAGKIAGCISIDAAGARRYVELGARYIATHAVRHMNTASRQFMAEVKR